MLFECFDQKNVDLGQQSRAFQCHVSPVSQIKKLKHLIIWGEESRPNMTSRLYII